MKITISPGLTTFLLWLALVALVALPAIYLNAWLSIEVWDRTAFGDGPWTTTGNQIALIVGDLVAIVVLLWKGMDWSQAIESAAHAAQAEERAAANRAANEKRDHERTVERLKDQLGAHIVHTDEARQTIATLQQQISELTKELRA